MVYSGGVGWEGVGGSSFFLGYANRFQIYYEHNENRVRIKKILIPSYYFIPIFNPESVVRLLWLTFDACNPLQLCNMGFGRFGHSENRFSSCGSEVKIIRNQKTRIPT